MAAEYYTTKHTEFEALAKQYADDGSESPCSVCD